MTNAYFLADEDYTAGYSDAEIKELNAAIETLLAGSAEMDGEDLVHHKNVLAEALLRVFHPDCCTAPDLVAAVRTRFGF